MTLSDTATAQLWETFRAGGGAELVRDAVRLVLQELIEAEATEVIGAGRYERSEPRVTERNGHRPRLLATQAGDVELKIPRLRKGSLLPSVLEPRRRIDRALHAVIMEAYVAGVSTRSVDDCDIGDSEREGFWPSFFGSLRARGLTGVRLVIADAHAGLGAAADRTLSQSPTTTTARAG